MGGELQGFLEELSVTASSLGIPKEVAARAKSICVDAAAMRFCRVTSKPVLAAAALYVACREFREPLTMRDLAGACHCEPRDVGRCYVTILERMHISRPKLNGGNYLHNVFLGRPVPSEAYRISEGIIRKASAVGVGGRNPMTLAAAALYLACCGLGERVTQAEVAEAAGVWEESVRETSKTIRTSKVLSGRGSVVRT